DLGDVPVPGHLVFDGAAVGDDVRAVLGERPGNVLEQARAVPGVDGDLDAEALAAASLPLDRREPFRVAAQRAHVRAVAAVDRDPLAERDVADDVVAGNGCAALGEPDEDVLDSDHVDAVAVAAGRVAGAWLLERDRLLGDLADLELLQDLVDDLRRGQLPRAERDVEVLGLLVAGLPDHPCEDGGAGELLVGEVLRLERVLERLAALRLEILLLLTGEELPDLVAGARRGDEREPVTRGAAGGGLAGENLDAVAAVEAVVERHDPPVHLGA